MSPIHATPTQLLPRKNPEMQETIARRNEELKSIIRRTKVDTSYAYERQRLLDEKVRFLSETCSHVLDFGKSSRHRYNFFRPDQIETADINQYDGYPDIFIDICDQSTFPDKTYDAIICNAVIEHVYDPQAAVRNMHSALKDGGICFAYAPFMFRYHSPKDLEFQDYFRFTRDGLAYLFRDFREVTLYSTRGRSSTALFMLNPWWKYFIEAKFPIINKWADRLLGGYESPVDTTGYQIWAVK